MLKDVDQIMDGLGFDEPTMEVEIGHGLRVVVQIKDDYDGDISWLGKHSNKEGDGWFVDKKTGHLYTGETADLPHGEYHNVAYWVANYEDGEQIVDLGTGRVDDEHTIKLTAKEKFEGLYLNVDDGLSLGRLLQLHRKVVKALQAFEKNHHVVDRESEYHIDNALKFVGQSNTTQRPDWFNRWESGRYFIPENCDDDHPEYALQDYEFAMRFGIDWGLCTIITTIVWNDTELDWEVLGSVASFYGRMHLHGQTYDNEYHKEVVKEMLDTLLTPEKLQGYAETLQASTAG